MVGAKKYSMYSINKLINLANYLDKSGFKKEADKVGMLTKIAGKLEDAIRKHPEFEAEIRKLSVGVRPGHFEWALEELVDGNATAEEIIPVLDRFQKIRPNLERNDLYQYWAINQLKKVVENYGSTSVETRSGKKQKRFEESDIIYNSDAFKVVWPKTEFASCEWTGKRTKWCISAKESNMYDSYSSNNVFLYFVLNKNLSEDDPNKRISVPTMGDMNILDSEVRNALDDYIGTDSAREAIGEEFDVIQQKILEHASSTEFTENITDQVKNAARKIKGGEEISKKELEEIFKVLEDSSTRDTYWTHLILNALLSHPNLAETIIMSNPHHKSHLHQNFIEVFDYKLSEEAKKAISSMGEYGLDIYLIENYNVSDSVKLESLTKFFKEDITNVIDAFPIILDHLLKFNSGKKAIFDFLAKELLPGEVKDLIVEIDDETLLYLFNARELEESRTLLEQLGVELIKRSLLNHSELNEKLKGWHEASFD